MHNYIIRIHLEEAIWNASMVVMVAFNSHSLKEISRTQLAGIIKLYGTPDEKRELLEYNKRRMISPVANMLIREKIVTVKGAVNIMIKPVLSLTMYVTNH